MRGKGEKGSGGLRIYVLVSLAGQEGRRRSDSAAFAACDEA
jgi:hypothetical protein